MFYGSERDAFSPPVVHGVACALPRLARSHMLPHTLTRVLTDRMATALDSALSAPRYANGGAERRAARSSSAEPYDERASDQGEMEEATPTASGANVYVGNLSWSTESSGLREHMQVAGNVVEANVMLEQGGRSKGCSIVSYSTPEEAQNAISTLHNTELDGRLIFVREDREQGGGGGGGGRGRGGGQAPIRSAPVARSGSGGGAPRGGTGCRVYVGNLSYDTDWTALKDHMRGGGDVAYADVLTDPSGRSKGCGVVESLPMMRRTPLRPCTTRNWMGASSSCAKTARKVAVAAAAVEAASVAAAAAAEAAEEAHLAEARVAVSTLATCDTRRTGWD